MGPHIAASYLVQRAAFRVAEFFRHWYVDGTHGFIRVAAHIGTAVEQVVAVRVTLRFFFQPLFRDYTVLGRMLGPIFRAGRLVVGLLVYMLVFALLFIGYVAWIALPALLAFYAVSSAF